MTLLKVDITKSFGDFTLRSKFETSTERFALLGSSGSGKSLTLKCIAGIEEPDEGRITLGEKVLFDSSSKINLPPGKRHVGYLFQNYALFPNLTAYENINIVCKNDERTRDLLRRFNILSVSQLKPSDLSGGQCQRTALARMLASDPEVILLDEPFCALDNYMHTIIEREIMDILNEYKGPSVLVSHDRNEVYRMCGRIGVMDNGTLTDVQDKKSFFQSPSTVVAARLTGCKNITRICSDGYAPDWGIRLRLPQNTDASVVRFVGYRAHYFERVDESNKNQDNVFEVKIERVIEDTFSTAYCFKQKGNSCDTTDSVLTWITDKGSEDEIVGCADEGKLFLRMRTDKMIMLER